MNDVNSRKISGAHVRTIREELGLTQDELSEKLELMSGGKYISQIECGNRALPARHAQKLIDMAVRPTSYKWLMGLSEHRSESEEELYKLAADMVNHETVASAINQIAYQHGYLIIPPNTKELETAMDFDKRRCIISKDDGFIVLSSNELLSLEALISDFVKLQFDYLFNCKPVITEETILKYKRDNNG